MNLLQGESPILSHIIVYPIKSLDGVEVTKVALSPGGTLRHDREFAIVDAEGNWVNGKRYPQLHKIRATFDLMSRTTTLRVQDTGKASTFHLDAERSQVAAWLSDFLGMPVTLQQNQHQGFPDDPQAYGPTVVSTATLLEVTHWYSAFALPLLEIRQRFRTNLEIAEVPAFWEDHLYSDDPDRPVDFQIGPVHLQGINPCQRCIVPTRNPLTGEVLPNFKQQFIAQRSATLPDTVARSRFNHFYRLAVNTRIASSEAGKILRIGDAVTLKEA
ncbi:MOSC domain-containing protein [Trichothermofontia sp.]